jgi:hypothetical protein
VPVSFVRQTFDAAAAYSIADSATGQVQSIKSAPTGPSTGATGTPFTVTWAANPTPAGFTEDIQVMLPGTTNWVNWLTSQTGTSAGYTATTSGTYKFRGRLRHTGVGDSLYGLALTVTVS